MTTEEHLLTCLVEECSEIAQHTCKALRFGLDDKDPTLPAALSERENIVRELNDLHAIVEMLQARGILPPIFYDGEKVAAKKLKVAKFLGYARERGTLQDA